VVEVAVLQVDVSPALCELTLEVWFQLTDIAGGRSR
jgi:hypothetical protein